jgi:hypothetical protein
MFQNKAVHRHRYLAGLLLVSMSGLSMYGCSSSSDDNSTVTTPPEVTAESISAAGQIVNAKTGAGIDGVTLTITGADSDKVYNGAGVKDTSFTTDSSGLVQFYLRDVIDYPVDVKVLAKLAGYETTGATVQIASAGDVQFEVRLIDTDNPPTGVAAKETTGTATDGVIQSEIVADSGTEAVSGGQAKVTVPAGITATDASGNPATGDITVTTSYQNNESTESLATFPGGLTNADTDQGKATFVAGGTASFLMVDSEGKEIKKFNSPITLTIRIPKTTINPETGVAVVAGDTVPVWSYDSTAGKWLQEAVGVTIQEDADTDTFFVEQQTSHLSNWSAAWKTTVCDSEAWNLTNGEGHNVKLMTTGMGYSHIVYSKGAASVSLRGVPSELSLGLKAYLNGEMVGEATAGDLCAGGTINLNIPEVTYTNVDVTVEQVCSSDSTKRTPMPSSAVWFDSEYIGVTDSTGTVVANKRVVGTTYAVRAYDRKNEEWLLKNFFANGTSNVMFEIESNCTNVTGGS